jgi:hypothetical protein
VNEIYEKFIVWKNSQELASINFSE